MLLSNIWDSEVQDARTAYLFALRDAVCEIDGQLEDSAGAEECCGYACDCRHDLMFDRQFHVNELSLLGYVVIDGELRCSTTKTVEQF